MQFKRASEFAVPDLTQLWNRGYAGFFVPSAFTDRQMAGFIWSSDIDLERSVVAVDDCRPAGFSLLGVRGRRGWIGGVGVAQEYRGLGLGSDLFGAHMAIIRRETGLSGIQLEVLVQNWAHKLYDRNGFTTKRRLSFLEGRLPEAGLAEGHVPEGRSAESVSAGAAGALLTHSDRLHNAWPAVWQREPHDLRRCVPPIERALWAGLADAPDGYLLYNQHGRELWIADAAAGAAVADATAGASAAAAVAARLLDALTQMYPGFTVAIGDEPAGSPFHQAFIALGCHEAQARWEMHCPL